ncbi:hypothetical protein [Dyadobacter sp. NIV53]|nr:hypothetical protein [Dyadobacter sp. NIV53]
MAKIERFLDCFSIKRENDEFGAKNDELGIRNDDMRIKNGE